MIKMKWHFIILNIYYNFLMLVNIRSGLENEVVQTLGLNCNAMYTTQLMNQLKPIIGMSVTLIT